MSGSRINMDSLVDDSLSVNSKRGITDLEPKDKSTPVPVEMLADKEAENKNTPALVQEVMVNKKTSDGSMHAYVVFESGSEDQKLLGRKLASSEVYFKGCTGVSNGLRCTEREEVPLGTQSNSGKNGCGELLVWSMGAKKMRQPMACRTM